MEPNGKLASGTRTRTRTLTRCHALLDNLDPKRPPGRTTRKEFMWQYRALKERVEVYRQLLSSAGRFGVDSTTSLQKAETALVLSLQYFDSVFEPVTDETDG